MTFLRTASFGILFAVTFTVAATFQVVMALLGLVLALTTPALFKMNGAPAANGVQAIGVLVFLLIFALLLNAMTSAVGSGLWLAVRRLLPGDKRVLRVA